MLLTSLSLCNRFLLYSMLFYVYLEFCRYTNCKEDVIIYSVRTHCNLTLMLSVLWTNDTIYVLPTNLASNLNNN